MDFAGIEHLTCAREVTCKSYQGIEKNDILKQTVII